MSIEAADKLLLSAAELASILGISRTKVFSMMACGQLPPSVKLGGSRRWSRALVERWVELNCPPLEKFLEMTGA